MTPAIALASAAFRLYVLVSLSALGGAGAIIAAVERVLRRPLQSIRATWRSWLWMTPLVLVVVLLGREATILGVTALSLLGFLEFARATRLSRNAPVAWTTAACIGGMGILTLAGGSTPRLYLALPVLATIAILAVPVLLDRTRGQLRHVALGVLSFTWIGWSLGHVGLLTGADQPYGPILFLVLSVELCDVAAFTAGRLFGRHRLRPRVSPGKTWAGLVGATALGLALPWLLGSTLPGFGTGERLLAGLTVGLGGQLGDLAMSAAKRDLGVKDLGNAIPGHGGVLDRIDSLLFAAPIFFHVSAA